MGVSVDPVSIMRGRWSERCRRATRAGENFAPDLCIEVGPIVESELGEVMKWSGRGEVEESDESFVLARGLVFCAVAEGHLRGGIQRGVDRRGKKFSQLSVKEEMSLPMI